MAASHRLMEVRRKKKIQMQVLVVAIVIMNAVILMAWMWLMMMNAINEKQKYKLSYRDKKRRRLANLNTLIEGSDVVGCVEFSQSSHGGGSIMEVNQNSEQGRGKNKRRWAEEEEVALINALAKLSSDPKWRGEGNFKGGYLKKLESMLQEKLPTSGLKATPHIDSKTKLFRDKYNVICEMRRRSEFSWNDSSKMIMCERQAYDEFLKNHKAAKGLWKTPFPYLDVLEKIFGADRANGGNNEDFPDAGTGMGNNDEAIDVVKDGDEDDIEDDESVQSAQLSPQPTKKSRKEKGTSSTGKRKMSEVIDLSSIISDASKNITMAISGMHAHLETIASAFAVTKEHEQMIIDEEKDIKEKKKRLQHDVMQVPGLTRVEAVQAFKMLRSDENSLAAFYDCQGDEWKRDFLLCLVHPNIYP